jgi:pimeloyl-ACP methyl ester carboxylesterase
MSSGAFTSRRQTTLGRLNLLWRAPVATAPPRLIPLRSRGQSQPAVVFLHGFSGAADATWGHFPEFLAAEPSLTNWDIYSLGYATSLRIDVPFVWAADPPLARLALSFQTVLSVRPLSQYRTLAIIAHSMGGLVAQRAMLHDSVASKVGHLVLFGTPSRGLFKSILGLPLKRQARDMFALSPFILGLRFRWHRRYGKHRFFELRAVAGASDEFVPARSALYAFPPELRRVVPGNHLAIVKPSTALDPSVQVVVEALTGKAKSSSLVDSALLALEQRQFAEVISELSPQVGQLDDVALITLALALETTGHSQDALRILEQHYRGGTASADALGVLAGRIKRRWLAGRNRADWQRARDLYTQGLFQAAPGFVGTSSAGVDAEQAMYHAINIAFLDLLVTPAASVVPEGVRQMAERARAYASSAVQNHWRWAVEGDALAMLGNLNDACQAYEHARAHASSPREVDSMYSQAIRIAARMYGPTGVARVEECFRIAGGFQDPGATQPSAQ